jgi:hypothetical protein
MVLRSLDHVLALLSISPKLWVDAHEPEWWASVLNGVLAAPSWVLPAIFGGGGILLLNRKKGRPAPRPQG